VGVLITVEILGTKEVRSGELGDNIISMEDGSLLEKMEDSEFKLKPEITGRYTCVSASWLSAIPKGAVFEFESNRGVRITLPGGKTLTGRYMAYKNRITVTTGGYILSGEIGGNGSVIYLNARQDVITLWSITLARSSGG